MTFDDYEVLVKERVWPEDEAENLACRHRNWIEDALLDIQTKVPRERENHVDPTGYGDQFFHCGATVIEAPRGKIRRVWTELDTDKSDRVFYTPAAIGMIEQMGARRFEGCCVDEDPYSYGDGPVRGSIYTGGYTDANKPCRAGSGHVALHNGYLYLFPYLQSTEVVVVEWDGFKRSWEDEDEVTEDRDVQSAVELYLTGMGALVDDSDQKRGEVFYNEDPAAPGLYQKAVMKLIWRHRQEREIHPTPLYVFDNCGC